MLNRDWRMWGRAGKQLPPDEPDWRNWLILGGRGAGKTRAGAEWVKAQALGLWTEAKPAERIAHDRHGRLYRRSLAREGGGRHGREPFIAGSACRS